MIWFPVLALWGCASGGSTLPARDKPFYPEATHAQHFENFKATYHKQYAMPEEEQKRFNAFKKNLATINDLNTDDEHAIYDINEEADLTEDEIEAKYIDINIGGTRDSYFKTLFPKKESTHPPHETFDWRDKGIVSKPRDQKNCSASHSFATVGNIESHYLMSRKKHVNVSVQQDIDCDTDYNKGCNSGDAIRSCINYAKNGFMKEEDYKYVGAQNKCAYDSKKVTDHVKLCMFMLYPEHQVDEALIAGPLSAMIDGRQLQWYSGGILTKCAFNDYNYAMLLTGYGHDKNGVKYWSLQNSRGENWGEKGYVRIKRGVHCLGFAAANFTLSFAYIEKI